MIEGVSSRVQRGEDGCRLLPLSEQDRADAAIEALRDYRRLRRGRMDDVWRFAKVCRVSRVMFPYAEALP
jgi:hypothetical protein